MIGETTTLNVSTERLISIGSGNLFPTDSFIQFLKTPFKYMYTSVEE